MPVKVKAYKEGKRSGWMFSGALHGKRRRDRFAKEDGWTKVLVEQHAAKLNAEEVKEVVHGPAPIRYTFKEAREKYEEDKAKAKENALNTKVVSKWFDKMWLDEVTATVILNKAAELYPDQLPSRNAEVIIPARAIILNVAKLEKPWCNRVSVASFEIPKKDRPVADMEWMEAFTKACAEMEAVKPGVFRGIAEMMLLMSGTGLRISEACKITWDMIKWKEQKVYFPKMKNGKDYYIELPDDLMPALRELKADHDSLKLMGRKRAQKERGMHYLTYARLERCNNAFGWPSVNSTRKSWKDACAHAEIPNITPHEAGRRTFATRAYNELGMDTLAVMRAGRWDDWKSAERYIVTNDDQKKASEQLSQGFGKILAKSKIKVVK